MKHLCCSKFIIIMLMLTTSLMASLTDKSAIFYLDKEISYPMVGIHDYIVVNPKKTNTYTHGFSIYKPKIYAKVLLSKDTSEMDKLIEGGFENFYISINNKITTKQEILKLLNLYHSKYPKSKFIIDYKIGIDKSVLTMFSGIVITSDESIKNKDLKNIKSLGIDIIKISFMDLEDKELVHNFIEKTKQDGMIPYITNVDMDIYGKSSKNALKREILTLIDESKDDRIFASAHQYGALIFEYMGYIQKLHDINKGFPDIEHMKHYAGVVIWLNVDYKNPSKLMRWVLSLSKIGVKVVFADNFGSEMDDMLLKELDINIYDGDTSLKNKKHVIYKDEMIGFEVEPSLSDDSLFLQPDNAKALLTYEDTHGLQSTPAAITKWGGYAISEAFMLELNSENIWIINPFKFFAQSLRLKKLIVPDPTTQNGNRIFFTHVDGDGIMNGVESNPELYSGDILYEKILKPYKLPHSISIIGAEVDYDGLYPKIAKRLQQIAKDIYALPNVEPATHTFTHPFFWGKIKNGNLPPEFRLKPKGYKFSLDREIRGSLEDINTKLLKKGSHKKAQTVYWSGDCAPTEVVLDDIYKKGILNINGGDTTITNATPWLSSVAPLGLERGEYYQIYTGAQNENVFTNDWIGPFWGFKKVVQTFKLTNSPRRFKPIDVYYHIYSGSKAASTNAVKYVLDWSLKQDILPLYASEYIPQVMDFYTASIANDGDKWLISGMNNLKTFRIEEKDASIDLNNSKTVLGLKHFENHTYISLDNHNKHIVEFSRTKKYQDEPYLISSNAILSDFKNMHKDKTYSFDGHVDLKLNFHLPKGCKILSTPKAVDFKKINDDIFLKYLDHKKVTINVRCR